MHDTLLHHLPKYTYIFSVNHSIVILGFIMGPDISKSIILPLLALKKKLLDGYIDFARYVYSHQKLDDDIELNNSIENNLNRKNKN